MSRSTAGVLAYECAHVSEARQFYCVAGFAIYVELSPAQRRQLLAQARRVLVGPATAPDTLPSRATPQPPATLLCDDALPTFKGHAGQHEVAWVRNAQTPHFSSQIRPKQARGENTRQAIELAHLAPSPTSEWQGFGHNQPSGMFTTEQRQDLALSVRTRGLELPASRAQNNCVSANPSTRGGSPKDWRFISPSHGPALQDALPSSSSSFPGILAGGSAQTPVECEAMGQPPAVGAREPGIARCMLGDPMPDDVREAAASRNSMSQEGTTSRLVKATTQAFQEQFRR